MVRRVVTGHKHGRSVFLGDGKPEIQAFVSQYVPGLESYMLWSTPPVAKITREDRAETIDSKTKLLPKKGETRFVYLQLPPDAVAFSPDFNPSGAAEEFQRHMPDMAATREAEDPGMHRTDSVDYVIVLEGEVHLELDDQKEVVLRAHDAVVQNGTRHAWRNKSDRPVKLAVVMVGAKRG